MCLLLLTVTGCGNKAVETDSESAASIVFTDDFDEEITIDHPKKVAVLSASLADAWLLAGGTLSATTEDAQKYATEDTVVLGAMKSPNMELMISEEIDFVILSAAISEHVDMKANLEQAGMQTAFFEVETFEDYERMMKTFTEITGREDLYQKNVGDISAEIEKQIGRADGSAPKVLFLRAYSTGVKAKGSDSMTGIMLKDLGCVNIADSESGLLDNLSIEAIIEADPDYIFVTTMGESEEAAFDMVEKLLTSNPAWNGLKAVTNNHYEMLPKDLFHNKPNDRWGESYRILADYLYGEQ